MDRVRKGLWHAGWLRAFPLNSRRPSSQFPVRSGRSFLPSHPVISRLSYPSIARQKGSILPLLPSPPSSLRPSLLKVNLGDPRRVGNVSCTTAEVGAGFIPRAGRPPTFAAKLSGSTQVVGLIEDVGFWSSWCATWGFEIKDLNPRSSSCFFSSPIGLGLGLGYLIFRHDENTQGFWVRMWVGKWGFWASLFEYSCYHKVLFEG